MKSLDWIEVLNRMFMGLTPLAIGLAALFVEHDHLMFLLSWYLLSLSHVVDDLKYGEHGKAEREDNREIHS